MKNIINKFLNRGNSEGQPTKGLTIIESLVAISILVVAVLGPLVIISQALRISFFARDQMTSFYIAQEALEFIRNTRDRNSLVESDPANWLKGMTFDNSAIDVADTDDPNPQKYYLVRNGSSYELHPCLSGGCEKLRINTTNGVYGEPSTAPNTKDSIYTREITFMKAPGDLSAEQEVFINVVMKWNQVGGSYTFKLHDYLTNWKIQNYEEN